MPDDGVGGRAARHLDAGAHRPVEGLDPLGVDQGHRPLHQPVGLDERLVLVAEDVDEGVADADDVEGFGGGLGPVTAVEATRRLPWAEPRASVGLDVVT